MNNFSLLSHLVLDSPVMVVGWSKNTLWTVKNNAHAPTTKKGPQEAISTSLIFLEVYIFITFK